MEVKETNKTVDQFKFVTFEELVALNANHLIGTKKVTSHLHGFLIGIKLFTQLKQESKGFDYAEYKKKKIQDEFKKQIEDKIYVRQEKIKLKNKVYKVKDLQEQEKK